MAKPDYSSIYLNAPFMTVGIGCTSVKHDVQAEQKAIHEPLELKYFYEGSSTLIIGEKTVRAKAGDVIVINPYEFHATLDSGAERGKYHIIMISLDLFTQMGIDGINLRDLLLKNRNSFKTVISNNAELIHIFTRIIEEFSAQKESYQLAVQGLIVQLFALLLREGLADTQKSCFQEGTLRTYNLIEPALNHIRNNYSSNISIQTLASLCKISKHYFCRVFKSVMGKTSMEYLRDYRITVASTLLKNTEKSIAQVAELCGFSDENYFCRCYKLCRGISPGKYREKKRKESYN